MVVGMIGKLRQLETLMYGAPRYDTVGAFKLAI
jgi:hypothetical protein